MKKTLLITFLMGAGVLTLAQPAGRQLWNDDWTFTKDGTSRVLTLPHDWGVEQPFLQENPGESGKLAWWGKATYSKTLQVSADDLQKNLRLEVDGAFSNAKVFVNGREAGGWPYGYASWSVELTPWLHEGENKVDIALDNKPESSRWYPGGGIYRNVWLTRTEKTAVAHWGTYVTTRAEGSRAAVTLRLKMKTDKPQPVTVSTDILYDNIVVAHADMQTQVYDGRELEQQFTVTDPHRWSPATPERYVARTTIGLENGSTDTYETVFGIRTAEWKPDGFFLNGARTFLKGVCLHHDAGALGAVWNEDAWVRRLEMLKTMGCNAIRCSHNPPAPELLDLCWTCATAWASWCWTSSRTPGPGPRRKTATQRSLPIGRKRTWWP